MSLVNRCRALWCPAGKANLEQARYVLMQGRCSCLTVIGSGSGKWWRDVGLMADELQVSRVKQEQRRPK